MEYVAKYFYSAIGTDEKGLPKPVLGEKPWEFCASNDAEAVVVARRHLSGVIMNLSGSLDARLRNVSLGSVQKGDEWVYDALGREKPFEGEGGYHLPCSVELMKDYERNFGF